MSKGGWEDTAGTVSISWGTSMLIVQFLIYWIIDTYVQQNMYLRYFKAILPESFFVEFTHSSWQLKEITTIEIFSPNQSKQSNFYFGY